MNGKIHDKPSLADLGAFATIVSHRSFRKAAAELNVSPSTLSHMMRMLEERMGVRLLNRTTRSVAPTEVGERLFERLTPLMREFDQTLQEVESSRGRPSGTLRINTGSTPARWLLATVVPSFLRRYPDIALDIVTDGRLVDIVAGGFDAGIRLGESVPQDMIAVKFGGPARFVAIASPDYLAAHQAPLVPEDLLKHRCIRNRMPSGKLYRWEFEKHGQEIAIDVPGPLTLDSIELMVETAADGLGIAFVPDVAAATLLASGQLVTVLGDWCPPIDGLCLYYPGHRHVPPALRAFIDLLKEMDR